MSYIDGFVASVPNEKKQAYLDLAKKSQALFAEYGAQRVVECWGDDVPEGKVTDFRRAVAAKPGETVVFSWIVWPSKEVRDAANTKMRDDPRMQMSDMPFDGQRMIFGGFQVLTDSAGELK